MASFNPEMSLYIPRVDTRSLPKVKGNIEAYEASAKEFVAKQFKFQKIGKVDRVDLVAKETPEGYTYYIAFVHFEEWYSTPAARRLQEAIVDPEQKAKLQFHENWYWIISENTKPRTSAEVDLRLVLQAKTDENAELKKRLAEIVAVASFVVQEQPLIHVHHPCGSCARVPKRMETDDVATLQELLLSRQTLISELYAKLDETVALAFDPEDELGPPPRFAPAMERQANM